MTEIHNRQSGLDIPKAKANLAYSGQEISKAFGDTVGKAKAHLGSGAKGYAKSMLLAQHGEKYFDQPKEIRAESEKLEKLMNPAVTGFKLVRDIYNDPSSAEGRKADIAMSALDAGTAIPLKGIAGTLVSKSLLDSLNGLWKKRGEKVIEYAKFGEKAEISDVSAKVLDTGWEHKSTGAGWFKRADTGIDYLQVIDGPLNKLMSHDDLYQVMPSLRNISVKYDPKIEKLNAGRLDNGTIYIGKVTSADELKKILMHEIDHTLQDKFKFARGSGPGEIAEKYAAGDTEVTEMVQRLIISPRFDKMLAEGQTAQATIFRNHLAREAAGTLDDVASAQLLRMRTSSAIQATYMNVAGEKAARATAARAGMSVPLLRAMDRPEGINAGVNMTVDAQRADAYATTSARVLADAVANKEIKVSELVWHN